MPITGAVFGLFILVVIIIGKIVDWVKIKSEYLGGGVSLRQLAEKYKISKSQIFKMSSKEGWTKQRDKIVTRAGAEAERKIASAIIENADIAERIRGKLLNRLEAEVDRLPEEPGTECSTCIITTDEDGRQVKKTVTVKFKDLISAYHDLIGTDLKREKIEIKKQKADDW